MIMPGGAVTKTCTYEVVPGPTPTKTGWVAPWLPNAAFDVFTPTPIWWIPVGRST